LISVLHLGTLDYGSALKLQEHLVDLRKENRIADVLLLLEHPPVITLGRNANETNIVVSREFLAAKGVEVFEINRGGDVTFHGPGQLVGYPIFDLRGFPEKIGAVEYVRRIEEALIRTCIHYGIETQRIKGMTGVWTHATLPSVTGVPFKPVVGLSGEVNPRVDSGVPFKPVVGLSGVVDPRVEQGFSPASETQKQLGASAPAVERKIAAIGVHISRGVTSHGFALNVTTDLDFFKLIVPCGLTKPVTSIQFETGQSPNMEDVLPIVTRSFGEVFKTQVLWLESLDDLLHSAPPPQDTPMKEPEELRRMRDSDTHLA
jgi:lipoyl(octanoyl) transferase